MHSLGYVHCDIKSDNIMMGFQKSVKTKPMMFGEPKLTVPKLSWLEMETLPEYYSCLIDYGLVHPYMKKKDNSGVSN